MLVLSRKVGEKIVIGPDITVTVMRVSGGAVKLGVEAPAGVGVIRGELAEAARLARIKADHNTVRCPACQSATTATADCGEITYACCLCGWGTTQTARGDQQELALERRRSVRHGRHEQMGDGRTDDRPIPKGNFHEH